MSTMARAGWLAVVAALWPLLPAPVRAEDASTAQDWPTALYDPAGGADLVLPMPCGGSMAFQKILVPMDAKDPLTDRSVRLGQSNEQDGYAEYLRNEYLRGAFDTKDGSASYYYIGRYELTVGQDRALNGDCKPPSRMDRLAQGGLSWFDAVDLAQKYTVWLWKNARDKLPERDGTPGFVRLPTESEWEYAARGGARVDATDFQAPLFFGDGDMLKYAMVQAPEATTRGQLVPIGLRAPNPLGLFDMYGNAEELMLGHFRLNSVGRDHGELGGIVTRGGSVLSTPDQVSSATRTEYPPYDPQTGEPLRSKTFGVRFVISANVVTSDRMINEIRSAWMNRAKGLSEPPAQATDGKEPETIQALLDALVSSEIDPARKQKLKSLQLLVRRERQKTEENKLSIASATLMSGAVFVGFLTEGQKRIALAASGLQRLVAQQRAGIVGKGPGSRFVQTIVQKTGELRDMRLQQSTFLVSFKSVLDTLNQESSLNERVAAYELLRTELKESGQTELLRNLKRFWADLAVYSKRPDMAREDLMTLAVSDR